MRDLVFLAITVGFFTLAVLVVAGCNRIVGLDPDDRGSPSDSADPAQRELVDR